MTTPATPARLTSGATVRRARRDDLTAVEQLLAASELPIAGVAEVLTGNPEDFVVAEAPDGSGEVVAVAGLEVCPDELRTADALLRSVAVAPRWRAHGLGRELVGELVHGAEARGIQALYLLTMTAEEYFPRLGFVRIDRGDVPEAIAATLEFRSACPNAAIAMMRTLATADG